MTTVYFGFDHTTLSNAYHSVLNDRKGVIDTTGKFDLHRERRVMWLGWQDTELMEVIAEGVYTDVFIPYSVANSFTKALSGVDVVMHYDLPPTIERPQAGQSIDLTLLDPGIQLLIQKANAITRDAVRIYRTKDGFLYE